MTNKLSFRRPNLKDAFGGFIIGGVVHTWITNSYGLPNSLKILTVGAVLLMLSNLIKYEG